MNGLTAGVEGVDDWGYRGAKFPAVCGGNGFILVHQSKSEIRDGKYHWDVPPAMIHAMAIGVAHGQAIHEHDSDTGRNPTIFSREQSGKVPYLVVEVDDPVEANPEAATELRPDAADSCSAIITLTSPMHGFAYEFSINDTLLGRQNIPLVSNGRKQAIPLRDLPSSVVADQPYEIKAVTLDRTGHRSQPVVLRSLILKSSLIEARPAAACSTPAALREGLGISPTATAKSRDYLAIFDTERTVRELRPDMMALMRLDCLGIIATAPGEDCDFVSRFFAPRAGVPEDPVTGSAHCTLIPYWAERLGRSRLRALAGFANLPAWRRIVL